MLCNGSCRRVLNGLKGGVHNAVKYSASTKRGTLCKLPFAVCLPYQRFEIYINYNTDFRFCQPSFFTYK